MSSSFRAALAAALLLAAWSSVAGPSVMAVSTEPVAQAAIAGAPAPSPGGAELQTREAIARQRAEVLQRHAEEERACAARFAVTACIDEVRARQRAALAPLRERELALDDADRQRRAAERRAAAQARQQERAAEWLRVPPSGRAADGAAAAASAPDAADAGASAAGRAGPVQARLRQGSEVNPRAAAGAPQVGPTKGREARAAERMKDAEARRWASVRAQERIARRLREQAGRQRQPLGLPPATAASAPSTAGSVAR